MGAVDDVRVLIPRLLGVVEDGSVVLTWLVSDGLHLFILFSLCYGLGLINSATVGEDSLLLAFIVRFVVDGQVEAEVTSIGAHDSPAVSNVDDEYLLLNEEGYDGTAATLVEHVLSP